MNEPTGPDDDDRQLRASAVTASAAHHAVVSPAETSAALAAVRARAAAGDTGTIAPTRPLRGRPDSRRRLLAAAAALIVLSGGGALAINLGSDDDRSVAPATDPTSTTTDRAVTVPVVAADDVLIQLGTYVIGSVPDGYVISPELVVYGDGTVYAWVEGELRTGQFSASRLQALFETAAALPSGGTYGEIVTEDGLPTGLVIGATAWTVYGAVDQFTGVIEQLRADAQQAANLPWQPERWITKPLGGECEVVAAAPIDTTYAAPVFPHVIDQYPLGPCPGSDVSPTTTVPTTTTPATTVEPNGLAQPTIPYECVTENVCTQLIGTADGRIVAYSPADETLAVYDGTGTQRLRRVPLAEPLADSYPWLVTVGPTDMVYVNIATPGASDPISDLIAIPLTGPSAGTVTQRWTGLDGSGDSTLVPRENGLVTVPCCGFIETRPSVDAIGYPYVDDNGAEVTSSATTFRLDLAPGAGTLVRIDSGIETAFSLPTAFQAPRDFPRVVATTDGGALALDWIDMVDGGALYIARFFVATGESPQRVEVYRLDTLQVALLEPDGTVLMPDGDHFTRQRLVDVGTLTTGTAG